MVTSRLSANQEEREAASPAARYFVMEEKTEKPSSGFGKGVKNAFMKKFTDANNKKFGDKAYIKWNFTKFLVDREGNVIARFEPTEDMGKVREAVEAALA